MKLSSEQEKILLVALGAIFALLIVYRVVNTAPRKTAPLTFTRGTVARSPVRQGMASRVAGPDPLTVFLARRQEPYPGVLRDIFRMENPAAKAKPIMVSLPVVTAPTVTTPVKAPEKTPEEIAADLARADLSKFRFLGYLTEKDNTLFLSKEGELFMVKSEDTILKSYKIKETGKDFVVMLDTSTRVEVRIELSGGEPALPTQAAPSAPRPRLR